MAYKSRKNVVPNERIDAVILVLKNYSKMLDHIVTLVNILVCQLTQTVKNPRRNVFQVEAETPWTIRKSKLPSF